MKRKKKKKKGRENLYFDILQKKSVKEKIKGTLLPCEEGFKETI